MNWHRPFSSQRYPLEKIQRKNMHRKSSGRISYSPPFHFLRHVGRSAPWWILPGERFDTFTQVTSPQILVTLTPDRRPFWPSVGLFVSLLKISIKNFLVRKTLNRTWNLSRIRCGSNRCNLYQRLVSIVILYESFNTVILLHIRNKFNNESFACNVPKRGLT